MLKFGIIGAGNISHIHAEALRGLPEAQLEAVDSEKQQRLARAALSFLKQYQLLECSARFDVVSISWADRSDRPQIRHFVHAFEPVGFGQFFR